MYLRVFARRLWGPDRQEACPFFTVPSELAQVDSQQMFVRQIDSQKGFYLLFFKKNQFRKIN